MGMRRVFGSRRSWRILLLVIACAQCWEWGKAPPYWPHVSWDAAAADVELPFVEPKIEPIEPRSGPSDGACAAVVDRIRANAIAEMKATVAANVRYARANRTCRGSVVGFGCARDAMSSMGVAAPGGDGAGASQVSTTNNQITGVDEADFVKNDTKYIYVAKGSRFRIFKAWPVAEAREIVSHAIDGTARKLFVEGDRALVYSSLTSGVTSYGQGGAAAARECTYGYDCEVTGDGAPLKMTLFDISDRAAPKVIREMRASGSYIAARRVGTAVYTVVSSPGIRFGGLTTWSSTFNDCSSSDERVRQAIDALVAANERTINATPLMQLLPSVNDSSQSASVEGADNLLSDCSGFLATNLGEGSTFTTVVGFDMASDKPIAMSTIVSRPGVVFASAEALYVAVSRSRGHTTSWLSGMGDVAQATEIHKFTLDPIAATARYAASGVVKGRVLNQFSMDEFRGDLRVATTLGRVPDPNVYSTLTVFGRDGERLVERGRVDHIARHEDIRSVRFEGERGFIVTFKKTDPLYVFDLARPTEPRILGELKIPGFSTYMHMMDEKHLLTIGYDAEDHGYFAYFSGILLQIFDV
ncbi:MAG: beta-propeller domain-containing protein, partial [Deltaproteobacteria bacterium]|nr:beta-propeller domain-containing protein [Deltaproteobacteria bacterium]